LDVIGKPPFVVKNEKDGVAWETGDLLALRQHLLEQGQKGITIQRYKGLGEMNADQLRDTTMDPEKRTLLQISPDEGSMAASIFEILMGDQVEPRKEFIEKHAAEVRNLDV
jgi:DNA gyrase subunit B